MNRHKLLIKCDHCGKEVEKWRKQINRAKEAGARLFCNTACRILSSGQTPSTKKKKGVALPWVFNKSFLENKYSVNNHTMCWEWECSLNYDGYGFIYSGPMVVPTRFLAHRYSWTLFNGDIPKGLQVLHKCDNRRCINPEHLFLGTQKDNMSDMAAKGKSARKRIKDGVVITLTPEIVSKIKYDMSTDVKRCEIMNRYNISMSMYYTIKSGKFWGSILPSL